jgi:phosphate-selective porin OprO and OprP
MKSPRTIVAVILAALTLSLASTAPAVEISQEKLDALIKRIDELEQKVDALEQKPPAPLKAVTNASGSVELNPQVPPVVSLGSQGLVVRSEDSNFVFNLHGFMQADARFYFGDKTVPDTFLLRRIRPIFEGTVYSIFDYRLQLDFASNVTSPGSNNDSFVTDAYINTRPLTNLQVQVGKMKPPVGLERDQTTANLQFVETGLPTQFTPNYDLGAMIHNGLFDHTVNYALGIYNGAADGGSDDIESTDEGKEMVGRIFAQPFLRTDVLPLRGLGFGAGASYGYRSGPTRAYTTQGQQTFFSYGNATSSVTYSGEQYRIDPQGYYYWGPFGIYGEYVLDSQSLRSTSAAALTTERFNNTAWQVVGSYLVTGENNSFAPIMPQNPVVGIHDSGWGALELVARIGQMTMDGNLFPLLASTTSAHEQTSWGVGANWHLNRNVKLQLDYESTTFRNGSSATGSATARPEHVILSRLQLNF